MSAESIALCDFRPAYCLNCGFHFDRHSDNTDYWLGAAHECPQCHIMFAYTKRNLLLAAAQQSGSDLHCYATQERTP